MGTKLEETGQAGASRRRRFHTQWQIPCLFNALLPADDPSHELGVPEQYKPLVPALSDHLDTNILGRDNYCSAGGQRRARLKL